MTLTDTHTLQKTDDLSFPAAEGQTEALKIRLGIRRRRCEHERLIHVKGQEMIRRREAGRRAVLIKREMRRAAEMSLRMHLYGFCINNVFSICSSACQSVRDINISFPFIDR